MPKYTIESSPGYTIECPFCTSLLVDVSDPTPALTLNPTLVSHCHCANCQQVWEEEYEINQLVACA